MKNYLLSLLFVMAGCTFCFAQDTVRVEIPQLLESGKVDSLILAVIKSPENLKVAKNDSCLLLSLNKMQMYSYIHGIHALSNKETIFSTGNFENQTNIGYFEAGGYLVFVYGDDTMNKLFANTHQTKEFTFIHPTTQQNIFVILNYLNLALSYDQGVFKFKAR
jgi:hypothetical protein